MSTLSLAVLALCLNASCTRQLIKRERTHVRASVGSVFIDGKHATESAKYYLEQYRKGIRSNPKLDDRISLIRTSLSDALETRSSLNSRLYGNDYDLGAAILGDVLADRVRSQEPRFYPTYNRRLAELDECYSLAGGQGSSIRYFDSAPRILFVPGAFYSENVTVRNAISNFSSTCSAIGIQLHFVATDELGGFDCNVSKIARAIEEVSGYGEPFAILSLSRGTAEVQAALTKLNGCGTPSNLHTWISVSGIPSGSHLAARATRFPQSVVTSTVLKLKRIGSLDDVREMSPEVMRPIAKRASIPASIRVMCTVPIAFESTIAKSQRCEFKELRQYGINDTVGLCADAIVPGSIAIPFVGVDHNGSQMDTSRIGIALIATAYDLHRDDNVRRSAEI